MKTVLLKAKQIAFQLGVLFANTLTTGSVSNKQSKWLPR
jgi:hypothetical protein